MAFHPITSFRKYKKFWMAAILLLCMITFVLCTGTKGDLSEMLLNLFRSRSGPNLATAGGAKLYQSELQELKVQRNLANEFMRKCTDEALRSLVFNIKELKNDKDRRDLLPALSGAQIDLEQRLLRPRYFETGVKLEELVDFKLWLQQADRLGINLTPDHVVLMLYREMLQGTRDKAVTGFGPRHRYEAYLKMARGQGITETLVLNAVRDEFRVRIAQIALMKAQLEALQRQPPRGASKELADAFAVLKFSVHQDYRLVASPGMIWEFYINNAAPSDLRLVQVDVQQFTKDLMPPEGELKTLFKDHRKDPFDPSSDKPGFQIPPRVKVEWVSADPDSPAYRTSAKSLLSMQATPVAGIAPLASPLANAVAYAWDDLARRQLLHDTYDFRIQHVAGKNSTPQPLDRPIPPVTQYDAAPLLSGDIYAPIASYFADKQPEAAAALVGSMAQPGPAFLAGRLNYLVHGQRTHPREVAAGLAEEARFRFPLYATLTATAIDSPLAALAQGASLSSHERLRAWSFDGRQSAHVKELRKYFRYLPLEVVEEEIQKILERRQAEALVNANMIELKQMLDQPKVQGKSTAVERILKEYVQPMGLEQRATKEFYTRYDIDQAKEMEPLRKSFDQYWSKINVFEGRDLAPETKLKEGDFWKMFFSEGGETFAAVGNKYKAKPWPPEVTPRQAATLLRTAEGKTSDETLAAVAAMLRRQDQTKAPTAIRLFDKAERPFLFWMTDQKTPATPDNLDDVRQDVEKAWRTLKARDTALGRAKEIAESFQKSGDFGALNSEALKLGHETIKLDKVAPLVMTPQTNDFAPRVYSAFTLPKNQQFAYPREDMADALVKLTNLKEAIETGNKEIDDINKALFKVSEDMPIETKRFVQILTNKPRTTFYVGVLVSRNPSQFDFYRAYTGGAMDNLLNKGEEDPMDNLLNKAQEEFGRTLRREIIRQLRGSDYRLAEGDERKHFDSSDAS